jgi:hypothetical protein
MAYDVGVLALMATAILGIVYAEIDTRRKGVRIIGRTRPSSSERESDFAHQLAALSGDERALLYRIWSLVSDMTRGEDADQVAEYLLGWLRLRQELKEGKVQGKFALVPAQLWPVPAEEVGEAVDTRKAWTNIQPKMVEQQEQQLDAMMKERLQQRDAFEKRLRGLEQDAVRKQERAGYGGRDPDLEAISLIN